MTGHYGEPFVVEFDLRVVRLAAIKKAVSQFGDRCVLRIEMADEVKCRVLLQPRAQSVDLQAVGGQLQNAVLDQELREVVADETGRVRDLLLAQAFSGLSLIDPVGETASAEEDPLGVRHNL